MNKVILLVVLLITTFSAFAEQQKIDPEVSGITRIVEIRYHDANHKLVGVQTIVCNGQLFGDEPAVYDHKHYVNTDYCGGAFSPVNKEVQDFCESQFKTLEDRLACINLNTGYKAEANIISSDFLYRRITEYHSASHEYLGVYVYNECNGSSFNRIPPSYHHTHLDLEICGSTGSL